MQTFLRIFVITMVFCGAVILAQSEEEQAAGELIVNFVNPPSTYSVTVKLESVGQVWNQYHDTTSAYPGGTANYTQAGRGYHATDFDWSNDGYTPIISLGLYKLSVWESSTLKVWCYLDYRTDALPTAAGQTCIDVVFNYDVTNDSWAMSSPSNSVINGQYFSIWELKGYNHTTSDFDLYWSRCLTAIPQKNTSTGVYEPFLCWGPYNGFQPSKYKIYWREGQSGSFSLLDSVQAGTYTFQHSGLAVGDDLISEYKVVACSLQSTSDYSNVAQIGTEGFYKHSGASALAPLKSHTLYQNFPNPFNPSTIISWQSRYNEIATLKVFNSIGQEVATLFNGPVNEGFHSIEFNGTGLESGVYFYQLKTGTFATTKKLILIK